MQRLLDMFLFRQMAPHWVVVVLMGIVIPLLTAHTEKPGEFYPFSNYPMYDSFDPATYYVKVTDGADKPLPIGGTFGVSSSAVKKVFDRKLIEAKAASGGKIKKADLPPEVQAAGGKAVLEWLRDLAPADKRSKLGALKLVRVDIRFEDGKVTKSERVVGEVASP